MVPAEDREPS
ncbi:hypothetical protein LEMLEM_LOCUS12398 [Lemmus lemmus]